MEFDCNCFSRLCVSRGEGGNKRKKEVVLQRRERQYCGVREQRVGKLELKFSWQPTEETLDGSSPGKTLGNRQKGGRKEMLKKLMAKMQNEEGQGLVEYALIIVLVSVALILSLGLLAGGISGAFSQAISALS
jgi:pilus assembly protein Flp/PilA